ncbi:MAG: glycosyltransferase family 9 protein [Alphaproteobacteria bacterium]|nr:glycosyltransferase family 9 protein [Alphaproteobacteria bacterium]
MKILFITSSRLGDAILSTSILHYLEKKYPFLDVTVVCGSLPADLFRTIPFCSKVIILDKKPFSMHWIDLWKKTFSQKWGRVIDLRGSLLGYCLKTHKRSRWEKARLTEGHQVERLQKLMNAPTPLSPKLWLDDVSLKKAKNHMHNRTLAVAPTANWIGKQWPTESFVAVIKHFLKTYPDADILLVGAPHEGQIIQTIQREINVSNIKPLLSSDLGYVACCLSQCDAFLGNDSGLMHMAASLGIPTIGLFGPSDETRYGPYGSDTYVLRIPMALRDLEKTPGFSYSAPVNYMGNLHPDTVWATLNPLWESMHAKIDDLANIPLRSKGQSLP